MTSTAREKRRHTPLAAIPKQMQQAVLAIEDQRFYSHPGINPIRFIGAAISNAIGSKRVSGASTITEQLARMFFFEDEFNAELQSGTRGRTLESITRKARQMWMSLVLERRLSKDEILELYLNDVYLGQRGSFAIHGVPEAARLFFGKDVSNLSLVEAATIAGVIQSPPYYSPFQHPDRARDRRNTVLHAMSETGFISADPAERASHEPVQTVQRALESEAP